MYRDASCIPCDGPGNFPPNTCRICGGYARVPFQRCWYCGDAPSYHHGRCCPAKPRGVPTPNRAHSTDNRCSVNPMPQQQAHPVQPHGLTSDFREHFADSRLPLDSGLEHRSLQNTLDVSNPEDASFGGTGSGSSDVVSSILKADIEAGSDNSRVSGQSLKAVEDVSGCGNTVVITSGSELAAKAVEDKTDVESQCPTANPSRVAQECDNDAWSMASQGDMANWTKGIPWCPHHCSYQDEHGKQCEFWCAESPTLRFLSGDIHVHYCAGHRPMDETWKAMRLLQGKDGLSPLCSFLLQGRCKAQKPIFVAGTNATGHAVAAGCAERGPRSVESPAKEPC